VIYNIEKALHTNLVIAQPHPRSYGIIFTGDNVYGLLPYDLSPRRWDPKIEETLSLTWLIRPEDFHIPGTPTEVVIDWVFRLPETGGKMFKLQISELLPKVTDNPHGEDFDLDETGENAPRNQQDLIEITSSICDLSHIPNYRFRQTNPGSKIYEAHFTCTLTLSDGDLLVEISWNGRRICSTIVQDLETGTKSKTGSIFVLLSLVEHPMNQGTAQLALLPSPFGNIEISRLSLFKFRELIRYRFQLDRNIWLTGNCSPHDRQLIGDWMKRADRLLVHIQGSVQEWVEAENCWTREEYALLKDIQRRLLDDGKRIWAETPPWGEN
jgi:hypothetical protein